MPDAQVVMVIRNQLTTWPSWYANHGAYLKNVPRKYWRMHVPLEDWLDYCFTFPKQTPAEAMNYERFYNIFQDFFSKQQIHVFLYEELLENPKQYYQQWSDLLGIPNSDILDCMSNHRERSRNSGRRVIYDQWTSRLSVIPGFKKTHHALVRSMPFINSWLDKGGPAQIVLPDKWERRISEYYRTGNAQLSQMTGLDLQKYGYPV
jgi:hypothetical protein